MQHRAIFDHDAAGLQVTCEFTGAPDVDALAGLERANHFATNDYFTGLDFGADPRVSADCESPTAEVNFSIELAIHEQITVTGDFPFDLDPLTHGGWSPRRILRRGVRTLRRENRRRRSVKRGFLIAVFRFTPHWNTSMSWTELITTRLLGD